MFNIKTHCLGMPNHFTFVFLTKGKWAEIWRSLKIIILQDCHLIYPTLLVADIPISYRLRLVMKYLSRFLWSDDV